jgi:hypothetical protein
VDWSAGSSEIVFSACVYMAAPMLRATCHKNLLCQPFL